MSASEAIYALEAHHCRWPIGDPRDDDFHFCCEPIKPGEPYCAEHVARGQNPAAKVGKAA